MKKVNLAFGNPTFLYDYWKAQDLPETDNYYPGPYMNQEQDVQLEDAIRKIHKIIGNVKDIDQYSIVVGNGASQLLSAIMYETFGSMTFAPAPYFLRFPVLAQIADNYWADDLKNGEVQPPKIILTAPNNPTGDFLGYDTHYNNETVIVDACYNWPQYCDVRPLDDAIIVYSLAKATGHAATRIGWALFKDPLLAKEVKISVEMTTMGVSNVSQDVARFVLNREATRHERGDQTVFSYGKGNLIRRWEILKEQELPFELLNNSGMFAWCKGEIPDHVEGLTGDRFGDLKSKFRLNIGCSLIDFSKLIRPYQKEEEDD